MGPIAMEEALYYEVLDGDTVKCLLCPQECTIAEGKKGICRVRQNLKGKLWAKTFGKVSALHSDPIEKKPLYHFYPGSDILSVGSVGCNLSCSFCQNCEISQAEVNGYRWLKDYSTDQVLAIARQQPGNIGIAFTYNEPTIYYEFMSAMARKAKAEGMKTVAVSNGFINPGPLQELIPYLDAFNIDLKAFREDFYRQQSGARLAPVLETLKAISSAGKHLEITNLVIPSLNDDPVVFREMIEWIQDELGKFTVLHLSRYFPHHKLRLDPTPVSTLLKLYEIAKRKLPYTYLGNLRSPEGNETRCIGCGSLLIDRQGYRTAVTNLTPEGKCAQCGLLIPNLVT